ncbi:MULTISPECIES: LysR family transcriptional regulator [Bacillus]|uniref:LysR family transcriptional regulator n=2 Tax=Bacillus TaxID=1386 RepID=A0A0M4FHR7_9BACI|nr:MULTISPECIES: LysR family transcriptional regulator [Bacillus]ALC82324.1 LysR family transcriptional regulator [Bacillus gobiensis]MBP1081190.1 DNA-binding transcriptional LysR family regulator [Bacillus capparidis]MED1095871.1 LysR family transcriptional regulator [Bacillus capparidis]
MELRQLKTFQVAAENLNFTKTAQALNFTQPTVSSQIQVLEQELNQQLFFRIGKKLILTPAGKLLKTHSDQIFSHVEKIETEFLNLSQPNSKLVIAAAEVYCSNYLLPITTEYLKNFPKAEIQLLTRSTNDVIKGLLNSEYDIGVIAGEVSEKGLRNLLLEEEEMLLVVSMTLYDKYGLNHLLSELPFLEHRISGYFQDMLNRYINRLPFLPKHTILVESEKAIKQGILNQMGLGVMTSSFVKQELQENKLVAIRLFDEKVTVKTSLITLEDKREINTIKSFSHMTQMLWNNIHELESINR